MMRIKVLYGEYIDIYIFDYSQYIWRGIETRCMLSIEDMKCLEKLGIIEYLEELKWSDSDLIECMSDIINDKFADKVKKKAIEQYQNYTKKWIKRKKIK